MIAAIMPCRGRAAQTERNIRRMRATAGAVEWQLIAVTSEPEVWKTLKTMGADSPDKVLTYEGRVTYWQGMIYGMKAAWDAPLLVNLANDLLPGHQWLSRAYAAYRSTFGDGPGLVGFNDGHHETGHSCHFLISRAMLDRYGGWPVWYDHAFGDTELCQRAIADGLYVKAPWATLYHDHPYFGGQDDAVYAEGRAQAERDQQLYDQRRARGWPTISR